MCGLIRGFTVCVVYLERFAVCVVYLEVLLYMWFI